MDPRTVSAAAARSLRALPLLVLLLATLSAAVPAAPARERQQEVPVSFCDAAAAECLFTFEGQVSTDLAPFFDVVAAPSDVVFTTRIVWKDPSKFAGIINANVLEPEFIDDMTGEVTPVSEVEVPDVDPFSETFFKPFCIREDGDDDDDDGEDDDVGGNGGATIDVDDGDMVGEPDNCFVSGIGHESFQPEQEEVAAGRCVRVWLTHWQSLDGGTGNVVENVFSKYNKNANYCVVFRT